MEIKERITNILNSAVSAPSGDNSQPWWFHFDTDVLEVHVIPDKDNPILNFRLSGSYIAIGALIENIVILASAEGLLASPAIFPDSSRPHLVARVTFNETPNLKIDPLVGFVTKRCTNRKPYYNKPIPEDAINDLLASAQEILDKKIFESKVYITTDKASIGEVASASSTMEKVALETEAIHRLFFKSIVWSEEEEKEKGMGLPIKTTELPPPIQLLFRAIRHWSVCRKLNKIGLSFLAAKANAETYAKSAAIGIVTQKEFTAHGYVNAGRVFERVWIKATRYGLALQPVTGLLFLAQRLLANDTAPFDKKHLPVIARSYDVIKQKFSLQNEIPAMLYRVGYADEPSARTIRRAPEIR